MLVLSRHEGEGVVVPDLDLAIHILKVAGGRIQIGIRAPDCIRVLRSELVERTEKMVREQPTPYAQHELRNRLNQANLALAIAEKHLERGDSSKAETALQSALFKMASESDRRMQQPFAEGCSNLRVLLVEDNNNESSLLAEVLQLSGVDVEVACNGFEAIKKLNQRIPAMVLLDMHMPKCDGPTMIKKIRCDPRFDKIVIYAVTGSSARDIEIRHGNMGIRRWFQKPAQSSELVQAIRNECSTESSVLSIT